MKPPFTAGLADFAGMSMDKAAAAADLGTELEAIGAVKGPAIGEANAIIGLGTGLGALGTKTMGFEVRHKGPATESSNKVLAFPFLLYLSKTKN
ncbi:hypothetical protein C0995_001227 [Termitomyces sp. Mi166|nr:hypothetical protein C0995_001227 [Termitomyces sp. Mi166\